MSKDGNIDEPKNFFGGELVDKMSGGKFRTCFAVELWFYLQDFIVVYCSCGDVNGYVERS